MIRLGWISIRTNPLQQKRIRLQKKWKKRGKSTIAVRSLIVIVVVIPRCQCPNHFVSGRCLDPPSTLLFPPNQRYYAGLSPECELLVMADNGNDGRNDDDDDDVIWSSPTKFRRNAIPRHSNCFATLRGPHLVVGLERSGQAHQVLWFSEATDEEAGVEGHYAGYQHNQYHQQHSTYLAQLDNDGFLVVYKVWNVPRQSYSTSWKDRVWIAASNLVKGQTKVEYDVLYSPFATTYRQCVYATGPLGCFRVARRLHELWLTMYYTVKGIITKVDRKLDEFMELWSVEDDFVRVFQSSFFHHGSSIGTKSVRFVRKVMQYFSLGKG